MQNISKKIGAAIRAGAAMLAAAALGGAAAPPVRGPATSTEIRIGNIMPYSGPASAYGVIGKVAGSYFQMINDGGGINGRKIRFISYDDAYSPPKAVEQARKLVESDDVLLIFGALGTASNSAIQKYMNGNSVPQLFIVSGATKFGDPANYPWTMGWLPPYQSEGRIYAKHVKNRQPAARIAVLYQNDDFGKDLLKGLTDGLGVDAANMIVATAAFEVADPTIDSHLVKLKASGADVLFTFAASKFAAQSLRKVAELNWRPTHFLSNASASVGSVLKPAGFENAQNVMSAAYAKDATDPRWNEDPGMKRFYAFLAKYAPETDRTDSSVELGYGIAQTLVHVLARAGDDLSRSNVMKRAAEMNAVELDTLLPGIVLNTRATDFFPIKQLQMMRFEGDRWRLFGEVIDGTLSSQASSN